MTKKIQYNLESIRPPDSFPSPVGVGHGAASTVPDPSAQSININRDIDFHHWDIAAFASRVLCPSLCLNLFPSTLIYSSSFQLTQ